MNERAVEVMREGVWYRGGLIRWRRNRHGEWVALVRYTTEPGMQYLHEVDQARVRLVT